MKNISQIRMLKSVTTYQIMLLLVCSIAISGVVKAQTAPTHAQAAICNCPYELISGPENKNVLVIYDEEVWTNAIEGNQIGNDVWRSAMDAIVFATENQVSSITPEALEAAGFTNPLQVYADPADYSTDANDGSLDDAGHTVYPPAATFTATITYADGTTAEQSITILPGGPSLLPKPNSGKLIKSITINGHTYLIGRSDNENVYLMLDAEGNISFRPTVDLSGSNPTGAAASIPIGTVAEWNMMGTNMSGIYHLDADINMLGDLDGDDTYGETDNNSVSGNDDITYSSAGTFSGVLDGRDYHIDEISGTGLFSTNSGTIKNLGIRSGKITGSSYYVGAIAGSNEGTIVSCTNAAVVDGGAFNYVGGIVGYNTTTSTVTTCSNTGSVSGAGNVGGIVGCNSTTSTVTTCYNEGNVVSPTGRAGGIVGYNTSNSTVAICYNKGSVSGHSAVGGVVGHNFSGIVANCYNEGSVSGGGSSTVGGVVGNTESNCTVTTCYNKGSVSGTYVVGGIVGRAVYNCTVTNCFWLDVDGDNATAGINNNSSSNTTYYKYCTDCSSCTGGSNDTEYWPNSTMWSGDVWNNLTCNTNGNYPTQKAFNP